jgi:glycosyltransferase involved in cell wall biosynthesis
MRILIVHNRYQQPGGEDVVFANETAILAERGHQVEQLEVSNDAVTSFADRTRTAISATWSRHGRNLVAAAIARHRPDIMHVHNFFPLLSPAIFDTAHAASVATVLTLHNFRITCASPYLNRDGRPCEKCVEGSPLWGVWHRCYRGSLAGSAAVVGMIQFHRARGTWNRVDRLVANSEFAREIFIRAGVEPNRLVIKPNCIADPYEGRQALPLHRRAGALFVGRLSSEKGAVFLIDTWRNVDMPLTVVGDGPLIDACRARAPGNVTFVGWRGAGDIQEMMRQSALLVVPSLWYEMFPLVMIEAMAAGLPLVTSDLGALPGIVTSADAGAVFRAGDGAALRAAIEAVTGDPERWRHHATSARTAFEGNYKATVHGPMLERIYADALAAARTREEDAQGGGTAGGGVGA